MSYFQEGFTSIATCLTSNWSVSYSFPPTSTGWKRQTSDRSNNEERFNAKKESVPNWKRSTLCPLFISTKFYGLIETIVLAQRTRDDSKLRKEPVPSRTWKHIVSVIHFHLLPRVERDERSRVQRTKDDSKLPKKNENARCVCYPFPPTARRLNKKK